MKAMLRILTVCTLLATALVAQATIRYVSPNPGSAPYTTITAALADALSGDSIVLGPGNYVENIGNPSKRIHFIGAGWDVCTWSGYIQTYTANATGTVFEGIRFTGGGYYTIYNHSNVDSITIRRCDVGATPGWMPFYLSSGKTFINDCVLHSTSNHCIYVPSETGASNTVIRNSVFSCVTPHPGYNAISGANAGTIELYNCVFLNFTIPFNVTGVPQVIGLNNIFWDWTGTPSYGTLPVGSVFEYTAAGGGAPAFPSNFTNNINLGSNNPFVNYATDYYQYGVSNLHLNGSTGGLQCVDAGYPSLLDLDSSPSDLGIYGGPKPFVDHGLPAFPFAITLNIDNLVEVGDSVNVVSSGRIGPRY